MNGLSPGIAYSCFSLLGLMERHPMPFDKIKAELPQHNKIETAKLIELCQELAWLRADESGVAVLTLRGARIVAADGDPAKLRLALLDVVELLAPPWARLAIDGRKKVLAFAPSGIAQCLVEAELATGYAEKVVSFWDQLAAAGRILRGTELAAIGRQGERLSLVYERTRTGREPKWRSIESNADGYDVLSVADHHDMRPKQIEVKASTAGQRGAMHLTRNEWEATELMPLHCFHLWDLSKSPFALAVVPRASMAKHVAVDMGDGTWDLLVVPFSAFADAFATV